MQTRITFPASIHISFHFIPFQIVALEQVVSKLMWYMFAALFTASPFSKILQKRRHNALSLTHNAEAQIISISRLQLYRRVPRVTRVPRECLESRVLWPELALPVNSLV